MANPPTTVHFVLPNDIDDPSRPSGGNVYDRRVIDGLVASGRTVREHAAFGAWPHPTVAERTRVADRLAKLPDGALVVVDGLVASAVPSVLFAHAERLRLVVLMHMPQGDGTGAEARAAEAQALASATAVVTTSRWCARRLASLYGVAADAVHVALPGVDTAPAVDGSPDGSRLLCVAAVTHHKGHDVLAQALLQLHGAPFTCVCAGGLDRDPSFVDGIRSRCRDLGERMSFVGALPRRALAERYARSDLLVLPSRGETYGMVVTEALARGIPVVATDAKGLPEALGHAPDGSLPGMLVPPDDASALASALRGWLRSPSLRSRLRAAARARRATLEPWTGTVAAFGAALDRVEQGHRQGTLR